MCRLKLTVILYHRQILFNMSFTHIHMLVNLIVGAVSIKGVCGLLFDMLHHAE